MNTHWVLCVWLLACLHAVTCVEVIFGHEDESQNMLKDMNWDFEQDISDNDWRIRSAKYEHISNDCNTGKSCLRVYDRVAKDSGVYIRVYGLKPSTSYYFSVFIKQLTNRTDGHAYSRIRTLGRYIPMSGGPRNYNLGRLPFTRADNVWKQLGADFHTPDAETKYHEMWVRVEPPDIEYVIDTAGLIELPVPDDFEKYTDQKIDLYRKTNLTVTGKVPAGATVVVELKNHEFGFGTAIKGRNFIGRSATDRKYRDFILEHFNWAAFENDMKWKPMEKRKGNVIFRIVDRGIRILKEHGFKVRGHAISWDLMDSNPPWVKKEAGLELKEELFRRIRYVVSHYKNSIAEWDVCNEYLHTHFFEDRTGLLEIIEDEFKEVTAIDSNAKLFLNDYQIVRDGQYTSAQANLATYLLSRGTPVHGIGIQSHLRTLPISPERLAKRIQVVGSAGLPISITEFSAHSRDINVRAKAVEQAFRVYFSEPSVHAIVLWGFGNQYKSFANDFFLTEGPNNKPNKAGKVMLNLFKKWHTYKKIDTSDGNVNLTVRAFYGDYLVTVLQDNKVISTHKIKVTRDGNNVFQL